MMGILRAGFKFVGFLGVSAAALGDYWLRVRSKGASLHDRAAWTNRWAFRYLDLLGVELQIHGAAPTRGVLACNHLSYLDIVVLSAARKQVFLSKSEVKSWPIIGALAQCAGTMFVRRQRKADVAELQQPFSEVVAAGLPITLFPEGTSSDGTKTLPFFSSLLEPAARNGWEVSPGWLCYRLDEGNAGQDVCYWGDMTFLPHFLKLLSKKRIYATIVFGEPMPAGLDRKELAVALHREVTALAEKHRENPPSQPEVAEELVAQSVS